MRTSLIRLFAVLLALGLVAPAHAQKTKSGLITEINGNIQDNSNGAVTPQTMRTVTTDMVNSWQQYAGVNLQAGTTYTVQASDYGQLIVSSNSGAVTISLPQAAGAFAAFNTTISYTGAGSATIAATGGSLINGLASISLAQNQSSWIVSDGTNWQTSAGAAAIPNPLTLALGGTNANLTASNGGLVYSDASKMQILAGTATPGQIPRSGISSAPSWSTATYPATAAAGSILNASSANVLAATTTPVLGLSGTLGTLGFGNATSGTVTLTPVAGALGSAVLTMPAATDTIAVLAAAQAFTNKTYNGNTWTAGTGTLTISAGKTASFTNTNTWSGTDGAVYTGPSTNATLAALNITDQTLTGGANVTLFAIGTVSSGTTTLDCGKSPLQTITNNGAFTLAPPANDGSCIIRFTNGASANTITFSGWTVGSNTGDTYATTNTNRYDLFVRRIGGVSSYQWSALQ